MEQEIRVCKKCGFILGTRPGLLERDGVCQACINHDNRKKIDFKKNQDWLTAHLEKQKNNSCYDCVIAVSGGKDSHMIVKRLVDNHKIKNPLLVSVHDEFTMTQAGIHNRDNICKYFNFDHLSFRCSPNDFIENTKKDFLENLNPLKWIEEKIYRISIEIAKKFSIKYVFFGEDSTYEYGTSEDFKFLSPLSDHNVEVLYMGAFYPYSNIESFKIAQKIGFKSLDNCFEWQRAGNIENFSQIDSIGYITHLWCKFPKFGFQRVSDMACRFVREGILTKEQALSYIRDRDYQLDRLSLLDFCRTIDITEDTFNATVDKHANLSLVHKDCNGIYRRNDLY